jgi:hypothetical protein
VEREAAEQTRAEHAEPPRIAVATPPTAAGQVLALQRAAGNRAVSQMLARDPIYTIDDKPSWQRDPGPVKGWDGPINLPSSLDMRPPAQTFDIPVAVTEPSRLKKVVFIMSAEDDTALKSAIRHYTFELNYPSGILLTPKDFEPTLFGIFNWLATNVTGELTDITIVSHGNRTGQLAFGVDKHDDKHLTTKEMKDAVRGGKLPKLQPGTVTSNTTIHLKACMIGNQQDVVELWDEAFGGEGVVTAAKVKVGFNASMFADEGLGGWWVDSLQKLTAEQFAARLEEKYSGKIDLDAMEEKGVPLTEHLKWLKAAEHFKIEENMMLVNGSPTKVYTHISTTLLRKDRDTDEYDSTLYSRSHYGDKYYRPTEL